MTATTTLGLAPATDRWRGLRLAAPVILAALVLLGLLFREEATAAVQVWHASSAYSHCWFILPIAGWLAWERRDRLDGAAPRPVPWLAILVLPLGLAWLAAERLGIMEGRQLVALAIVEVAIVGILGWRLARIMAAPLAYLVFLVPFGAFLTPVLQSFTAAFSITGLDLLGIPNVSDGYTIEIPAGVFYVAEACAGLRFLIASVAFGVLYALLNYRTAGRRIAFIAASVIIPVVANGIRALGIVVYGHILGSAEAAAADHLIYGWVFFSIVILLLTLAGLPFRQDREARAEVPPDRSGRSLPVRPAFAAVICAAVLAAIGPAAAMLLDRRAERTAVAATAPAFAPVPDCTPAASEPVPAASGIWQAAARFSCLQPGGRVILTATVQAFAPASNPGQVEQGRRAATGEFASSESETSTLRVKTAPGTWRMLDLTEPDAVVASSTWIDGDPALGGLRGRLRQALGSVTGAGLAPVVVTVAARAETGGLAYGQRRQARQLIGAFLESQPGLDAEARRVAGEAGR